MSRFHSSHAVLSWALVLLAVAAPPAASERREAPREKIEVKELVRLAAERTDRVEVGWTPKSSPLAPSALTWSELGPRPITGEYWSGNANAAGRVSCVLVHPGNANLVYIAAAQGGVWKTVNGGASWTPLTDRLSSLSSGWLTFDPSNANVLYYGTGEQHYSGDSFYGDGLFRSNDAGATWTKIASKSQVGSYIARVLVDPAATNRLLVASDLGVMRSVNGGSTWSAVWSGGPDDWANDLVFHPTNSQVLYAAIFGQGVYRSTNGGDTWTLLAGGLPAPTSFYRVNLAIAPSNGLVLYASFVDTGDNLLGMYRTTDGGTNWTHLTTTPNYMVGQGSYDNCMIVDPTNPSIFYAGGVFPYDPGVGDAGVIKTVDGGATWSDITFGIDGSQVHPDQQAMAFAPDGALWLANDGGVWKTTNGGQTWINRNSNLALTQFYKFGIHPTDPNQLIAGTQDNGTLIYLGNTAWPQLESGDGGPCGYDMQSPNLTYSTYIFMWYLERWNNYAFDTDVTGPWQAIGDRASFCNGPLVYDSNYLRTWLAGTYRVWKTADDGANWTDISPDLTDGGVLRSISAVPGVPNAYYASSTDGVVHYTDNGGATWARRSTGLPVAFLPDVVVGPNNSQLAYTCARQPSAGRVFKTANAGVTWTDITGNLPTNLSPHSLAVDFRFEPDKLYLGTDYGIWTSVDGGAHWTEESSGFPNCAVFDIQLDLAHNSVIAATHGRGMWRAVNAGPVAVAGSSISEASLYAVVPHPSRLPVTVRYDLPRPARVALEIFDVAGRRVCVLESGPREAGTHLASWDGHNDRGGLVGGGVYFYRLSLERASKTRRMVVLP
jgi:photosystem II stability/assembly factor-like uncharacterized protein